MGGGCRPVGRVGIGSAVQPAVLWASVGMHPRIYTPTLPSGTSWFCCFFRSLPPHGLFLGSHESFQIPPPVTDNRPTTGFVVQQVVSLQSHYPNCMKQINATYIHLSYVEKHNVHAAYPFSQLENQSTYKRPNCKPPVPFKDHFIL